MAIPGFTAHRSLYRTLGYRFLKKETLPSGGVTPALRIQYVLDGDTYVGGKVDSGGPEAGAGGANSGDHEDLVVKGICIRRCLKQCNYNMNTTCYSSCFKACYY